MAYLEYNTLSRSQGANRFTFWQPGARMSSIVGASVLVVCSSPHSVVGGKKTHGPQVPRSQAPPHLRLIYITGSGDEADQAEIRIWRLGRVHAGFGSVRRRLDTRRLLLSDWERFGKGSERFGKGWERFFRIFSVFSKIVEFPTRPARIRIPL